MSSIFGSFFKNKKSGYSQLGDTREERLARAQGTSDKESVQENHRSSSEDTPLLPHVKEAKKAGDQLKSGGKTARKIASTAQTMISAGGEIVPTLASVIPSPVSLGAAALDSARNTAAAVSTYKHIAKLKAIKEECQSPDVGEALDYAIAQKNSKLKRSALAAIPGAKIAGTIYSGVQALKKINDGSKGVERGEYAEQLWEAQRSGDADAEITCAELMGQEKFSQYKDTVDGHTELADKLKSTN